jgi:hypothetical protein
VFELQLENQQHELFASVYPVLANICKKGEGSSDLYDLTKVCYVLWLLDLEAAMMHLVLDLLAMTCYYIDMEEEYSVDYVFQKNCTLRASPISMFKSGNKTSWVDIKQLLWLLVRINFDILVRNLLMLKRYPNSLDKWTFDRLSAKLVILKC